MVRLISFVFALTVLLATQLRAEIPTGNFTCALSNSASGAVETAKTGERPVALTVAAGSFGLSGGELDVMGRISPDTEADASVTGEAGATFHNTPVHAFTTLKGEHLAKGAFSKDANGAVVALLQLTSGEYFLLCADKAASDLNLDAAAQVPAEQPQEEVTLTDEQKLEKLFNEAPVQRGKENEIFGALVRAPPDEGHYACKYSRYSSGEDAKTSDMIDTDDDHTGFDLFSDGSYRLKKTDGTFEEDGSTWRHNPSNGVVLFHEGTLSIYFKWPLHVSKTLDGSPTDVSLLYVTDYDYDGPLDDMTMCVFVGPPQSKSPKVEIAEVAQKNLNPPPPGSTRVSGLFYQQQWQTVKGPNYTSYQVDYYNYRYFQDNGYVWLEAPPDDGDFEKLDCNKPMVDDRGEPTCTTYTIEDGLFSDPTIRIGHDAAVPFESDDTSVSIDGTNYFRMPAQTKLILNKTLSYFSYTGILMREGAITFKTDGTFERTSGSGVLYTHEIPDVSRTSVTSYNPGDDLKGTYEINGHTITFTTVSGKVGKQFFGFISEDMIMVGGQPYIDRSD